MDYLKQLLPKYNIKQNKYGHNKINYNKLDISVAYTDNFICERINQIKFIHDNIDYIIEMLLTNGFLRNTYYLHVFKRDELTISIYYSSIETYEKKYAVFKDLIDPTTMFDDLRKFIGADISYKSVIKNE